MKCFQTYSTARNRRAAHGLGLSVGRFIAASMHHEQLGREGSDVRAAAKIVRSKCDSSHSRDFNARVSASTGISGWQRICVIRRYQSTKTTIGAVLFGERGVRDTMIRVVFKSWGAVSLDAQEYARSLVINQSDRIQLDPKQLGFAKRNKIENLF